MATAAVQYAPGNALDQVVEPLTREKNKLAKHDVATELNYYSDPGDGSLPAPFYVGQQNSVERPHSVHKVVIHDISGEEDKYTLDSHGFQIVKHQSKEKDFLDDAKIKAEYYPEVEQLLKDATGATRVFIFDHTIRRAAADRRDGTTLTRGPGKRVHIDQSYKASEGRVTHHLPDEADSLLQKRFQIINVWRPIKTVLRDPLGAADAHSVPESDLIPAALIYPDRQGETYVVRPNPEHSWYYKYKQTPAEPLLIKCFDSLVDGRARRVPHSAFEDPAYEAEAPRESIEVRTLVFYDY